MNKSQKILPTSKTGHGRTMAGGVATSSRRRRGRPATGHGGAAASAVGWRRLEKQANKEKSILELLFGEGKVAAAVAHLGGVKEIRDRERAPLVLACEWETVCMCAGSETCES